MAWTVWGDDWEDGQLSNTDKSLTIRFNDNYIIRAIRTWIIVYNDPVFTNLNMKFYSNEVVSAVNTPKKLLTTSTDVRTKAEIHTLPYAVKEIYFTFDNFPVQGNTYYNLVINGTGYVPTGSSYLAWMKGFPDPVYASNYVPALETIPLAPYQLYAIGGRY